ncbi:MAG: hypothetical protein HYY00_04470 [Chloroflexi bacterium]|nr:hypothetical protein [Chloroflexota bacterium]
MAKALSNQMLIIRSNYVLGLISWALLRYVPESTLQEFDVVLLADSNLVHRVRPHKAPPEFTGGEAIKVTWLEGSAGDKTRGATDQFLKSVVRQFNIDLYEIVRLYCDRNALTALMFQQPWAAFLRLVRSSFVHTDAYWDFTGGGKNLVPATWHGKTITKDMEVTPVKVDFYGYFDSWKMWEDVYQFASQLP